MFGCIAPESRKNRECGEVNGGYFDCDDENAGWSAWSSYLGGGGSGGSKRASSPAAKANDDVAALAVTVIAPLSGRGVRRDCSSAFMRLRNDAVARSAPRLRSKPRSLVEASGAAFGREEETCAATPSVDELAAVYEEASRAHTSLASKLAQHNGLRQFGVDFSDRAPPLELRILLPELEAAIERLLETLRLLGGRLEEVSAEAVAFGIPKSARTRLCENLLSYLTRCREEAQATYDAQRGHLRQQAAASPLRSPMMSPELGKRLADAMRSPSSSAPSTAAPSPTLSHSAVPPSILAASLVDLPLPPAASVEATDDGSGGNGKEEHTLNDSPMLMLDEMFLSEAEEDIKASARHSLPRPAFSGLFAGGSGSNGALSTDGTSSDM